MTRGSDRELYGKGYKWDGRCPKCGGQEWEQRGWQEGSSVHCRGCGWWSCQHGRTVHTSEDIWNGMGLKANPPEGCPLLQ